ncbi:FIG00439628: hypothetical protein [hydrothermal vent metagenome]|uniref:VWA domain-containing protein n=1 Tax=hydrothermal vent metagenome TaxID=652676 RepID=A0A3B0R7G8_9ZZZZ
MVILNVMSKTPVARPNAPATTSSDDEVAGFLRKVKTMAPVAAKQGGQGRLIFALDATLSREATWDQAQHIQSGMFAEAARIGGLDVQLVYFRGYNECQASKWVDDPKQLGRLMTKVKCRGGHTQIGKILSHIKRENTKGKVDAVVYVGDCMEENIDKLCQTAGEVGLLHVPVFMFQEGHDMQATTAFKEIARLTGGAHCRFSVDAADQLRQLLRAVAIYAAGGRNALAKFALKNSQGSLLLEQLR